MNNKIRLILLYILTLGVLLSCAKQPSTSKSELDKRFLEVIPINDMNKSLSIVVDSKAEYFPLGSDIPLIIENKSPRSISFDLKTHIRLLINTGSQWRDIENALTYSGNSILHSKSTQTLGSQYSEVEPVLNVDSLGNSEFPILLRIVIIGEFMRGDKPTGKQVAAYVDVFLKPTIAAVQPTETIIYSTEVGGKSNGGKIEGIITSKDDANKPLPNVTVSLLYHPIFNDSGQTQAIAITKTDAQGKYSFDNVKPDVYALHTTIVLESGASCDNFDYTRIIKIEIGTVATVNFSLACDHL